ncbi:MAG: NUDIX domain-containing protein [Paramuribaculum sp.]|nr:NUDIX domain-containing protein [Paramuribaculum sp.]
MLLHPVVHLHVVAPDGSIFLQKRSMTKDIQPGKWDTAVGGHIDFGEKVSDAILREAREELGIDAAEARLLKSYVFTSTVERELINTYYIMVNPEEFKPCLAADEVDEARFWTKDEIEAAFGLDILTPNLEMELKTILPLIQERL